MFVHILVLVRGFDDGGDRRFAQRRGRRRKPIKIVVLGDSLSAGLGLAGLGGVPGSSSKRP